MFKMAKNSQKKSLRIASTRPIHSPSSHKFDLLILISITLIAVASLYSNIATITRAESENTVAYNNLSEILEDGQIDDAEAKFLSSLGCEELKDFLGKDKPACLHFTDSEGNKIPIKDEIFIGCDPQTCGKISKGVQ